MDGTPDMNIIAARMAIRNDFTTSPNLRWLKNWRRRTVVHVIQCQSVMLSLFFGIEYKLAIGISVPSLYRNALAIRAVDQQAGQGDRVS